ncbi:putative LRR receptor-like serine/threonine-protein kinase [Hibiscus syriacus]|uniref:LRR receptor-like serine/threonine-protein kinase n=1 Tax=Hibiscus syriacus TaxID=106335 RepID=A0A6A2WNR4_HIBSY|nr:putative LRR receptor-like serine/threonine-protein kinase [Hibiscus syriacus]
MTRVSHGQLSQATDGFDESSTLGFRSFGCLYKGRLSDGTEVAVKVFNLQTERAFRSFDIKCEAMRNTVHRNLPNGSLESWLHSKNRSLDFLQRVDVMIDVAAALEHLHTRHSTPIIHCDVKPTNILLDGDMVAHVGILALPNCWEKVM